MAAPARAHAPTEPTPLRAARATRQEVMPAAGCACGDTALPLPVLRSPSPAQRPGGAGAIHRIAALPSAPRLCVTGRSARRHGVTNSRWPCRPPRSVMPHPPFPAMGPPSLYRWRPGLSQLRPPSGEPLSPARHRPCSPRLRRRSGLPRPLQGGQSCFRKGAGLTHAGGRSHLFVSKG